MHNYIKIRGARVHNLKNIDLDIPIGKISCLVGPSGSGKTTLAFHTLQAESKRRFLNALPQSMKLFSQKPTPVDIDFLGPVLPVFGLSQYNPILGSRSVVADTMGLTEQLQSFFYKNSKEYCPDHRVILQKLSLNHQVEVKTTAPFDPNEILHLFTEREMYLLKLGSEIMPSRSWNFEKNSLCDFSPVDDLYEIGRLRAKNLNELEKYIYKDDKCLFSQFYLYRPSQSISKLELIEVDERLQCPICFKKQTLQDGEQIFSPSNALGACNKCQGFGGILTYDKNKYCDEEASLNKNAVKIYKYSAFSKFRSELNKICKKYHFPSDKPLGELPEKFHKILHEGEGSYPGLNKALALLEAKKYRPVIKMIIRSIQTEVQCQACAGTRLNPLLENVYADFGESNQRTLPQLMKMNLRELKLFLHPLITSLPKLKEITDFVDLACGLGLAHLPMLRKTKSLSGGEYQRLLLLKFFSFKGTDSLFILDEPSVGLTQECWDQLWYGIGQLKELGNTVLIIEHNRFIQERCDQIIAIGPGSGNEGGEVTFQGDYASYIASKETQNVSLDYYAKPNVIVKNQLATKSLLIDFKNAEIYSSKMEEIKIYKNSIHQILGPSGSGKSALFLRLLANRLHYLVKGEYIYDRLGNFQDLTYDKSLMDVIVVDVNLKRFNSRSSVGSFTELAIPFRKYFASLEDSKELGFTDSFFSTNSELGQCPTCQGKGVEIIEMQYMEDISLKCDVCKGVGLKEEIAEISDGKITVKEALKAPINSFFPSLPLTPKFQRIYQALDQLKLSHLSLERPMSSLSGGEKQRLNLLSYILVNPKNTILFLENISFGLSLRELEPLARFLVKIKENNNTLVIIDQHEVWNHYSDYTINCKS